MSCTAKPLAAAHSRRDFDLYVKFNRIIRFTFSLPITHCNFMGIYQLKLKFIEAVV